MLPRLLSVCPNHVIQLFANRAAGHNATTQQSNKETWKQGNSATMYLDSNPWSFWLSETTSIYARPQPGIYGHESSLLVRAENDNLNHYLIENTIELWVTPTSTQAKGISTVCILSLCFLPILSRTGRVFSAFRPPNVKRDLGNLNTYTMNFFIITNSPPLSLFSFYIYINPKTQHPATQRHPLTHSC